MKVFTFKMLYSSIGRKIGFHPIKSSSILLYSTKLNKNTILGCLAGIKMHIESVGNVKPLIDFVSY